MNTNKVLTIAHEYCTGCGLCKSVNDTSFEKGVKGFEYPILVQKDSELCKTVCPSLGAALKEHSDGTIWGKLYSSWLGWSSDDSVRHAASSGGVLTSLCIYLLERNIVDGIIQVKKAPNNPCATVNTVSRTKDDVLSCMGSRYTVSSPLANIKQIVKAGEKYAFVGKPCDASALRMYKESKKEHWTEQILYIFSFFCAGQPSPEANNKLITTLGCKGIEDCEDVQYRGNGWPGKAQVWTNSGKTATMDYETSWMKILGRDVRPFCRFCADGTGEMADISCGDAWYLTSYDKPDMFTEHPGQNVIFARTQMGEELFKAAIHDGCIEVTPFDPVKDKLHKRQPYHNARKASLSSLKLAMKICGRNFPVYDNKKLAMFARHLSYSQKFLRCIGTIQRILKGKI